MKDREREEREGGERGGERERERGRERGREREGERERERERGGEGERNKYLGSISIFAGPSARVFPVQGT